MTAQALEDALRERSGFAQRFFTAVTAGDIAAMRAFYAPDAVIWHNHDGAEQTVEQNLATLGWIAKNVRDFRYEDVRLQVTPAGFVQQHTTHGIAPGGQSFAVPACIVGTVVDGRITRIDEYLDASQLDALRP